MLATMHYCDEHVCGEEMGGKEKQNGLCTMKRLQGGEEQPVE